MNKTTKIKPKLKQSLILQFVDPSCFIAQDILIRAKTMRRLPDQSVVDIYRSSVFKYQSPKYSLGSSLFDLIDKITISWRRSLAAGWASSENFRNQMYSSWRDKQPKQQECKWRSLFLSEFRRVRTESQNLNRSLRPNLTQARPVSVNWGQNLTALCRSTEWE